MSLPSYKCTANRNGKGQVVGLFTHSILLIVCFFCGLFQALGQADSVVKRLPTGTLVADSSGGKVRDSLALTKSPGSLSSEVKYTARDSIQIDAVGKKVHLYGEATVDYEDLKLKADYIYIDFGTNTVFAFGQRDSAGNYIGYSEFNQGGQDFKVRNMAYNFKTKKGRLSELVTKEGESIIYGKNVKKDEFNNSYITDARYTTCDAEHPHFYINARKLKVIPDKQVITGPAYLVIEDVPTPAFVPFGFFPITKKQKSGVLIPTYGSSPDRGFFLRAGGYYFAINDYLNAELRGDIYTQGSWGLYSNTNYKKRYHYNGNLQLKYYYNKFTSADGGPPPVSKDFSIVWTHRLDPKASQHSQFSATVNAGTSNALRFNSYDPRTLVTNVLQSTISYSTAFGKQKQFNFTSNLSHSQNTQTRLVEMRLPEIFVSMQRATLFKRSNHVGAPGLLDNLGIQYNGTFSNRIVTSDSLLFTRSTLDTLNYGMSHTIPISTSMKVLKYFTLSPSATYNEYWYGKTISKTWNPADTTTTTTSISGFRRAYTYNAAISLTTRIYGMLQFKKGAIRAIRHVITPSISWFYQPDFSSGKFNFYKNAQVNTEGVTQKYSIFERGLLGGPGQGRSGSIGYSLVNNIEMKMMQGKDTARHEKKIKLIETFNIDGSYNFLADSLKWSNISMAARTTVFKVFNLQVNATYDPYIYTDVENISSPGTFSKQRINTLEFNANKRPARMVSRIFIVSASLNKDTFKKNKKPNAKQEKMKQLGMNPADYVDFDMPWSLSFNYSNTYNRPLNISTKGQVVNFSGDLSVTKNWKVGFSSGYDFTNKSIALTTFDFHRNLHCWDFNLQWIPFGFRTSFFFTIKVRSSALQELKLTRRRDWFDQGAVL